MQVLAAVELVMVEVLKHQVEVVLAAVLQEDQVLLLVKAMAVALAARNWLVGQAALRQPMVNLANQMEDIMVVMAVAAVQILLVL